MGNVKKNLRWGALLWKRLYKKVTFLLLLVSIPLLVLGYGAVSKEESGVVTVALATEGSQVDALTRRVWDTLREEELVRYVECESVQQARDMVSSGDADTAWIFAEDLEAHIYDFIAKRVSSRAFVTVLEPENRVILKLLREVLSGTLFPFCSEQVYLRYIRENAPELDHVSEEQLLEYYQDAPMSDGLFIITDMDGNVVDTETQNYLLAPVRGMLAIVVVLAGLATAMYYIKDEASGTFACMRQRRKPYVEFGCQMISVVNVLAVVMLSLAVTGQTVHWTREVPVCFMFALCVAGFAMMVRRLSMGIRGLGMVTPLLVVVMLVVCPVFFDLPLLRQVQMLFPPTYFITAAYQSSYLLYAAGYFLATLLVCRAYDYLRHLDR